MYSQLRIEDVQVAQIVCVVGRAEPGQHQQQQSLHGQRSALLPPFSPASSPLCTEALSSSVLAASPSSSSPSDSPNLAVLTPPAPLLARLPCFSRDSLRPELLLHFPLFLSSSLPSLLPSSLSASVRVSVAASSSASGRLPGHLSCRGKRASCQRLKTERRRRRRRRKQQQKQQKQVQRRSPVVVREEEEKVQEEEEGDPCKGGTFGIQSEMCSPLICSGHWCVVRGFALVCVCVHVCLSRCMCVCARVCIKANSAGCDLYCSRNH